MSNDLLDAEGGEQMRLKCICGAEIYPATMEELRMYQQLNCQRTDNGKHNFKIWEREE